MFGDIKDGTYSIEQLEELVNMNNKIHMGKSPNEAFYKKSMSENGPSWEEKRMLVNYLIDDGPISAMSKRYLSECEQWIPRY